MCLAIPMKVISKKGNTAIVDLDGVRRQIDISLVSRVKIGDYVIVHAGFAIQKLKKKDAEETIALLKEVNSEIHR
ncbi:MAG: HypC/HybG/HupF family hydrogenase formation chaperone [Candidatus Omnitrophica bacterium]|nr:HypC/HybG/HupF family hydrogenase formation chaperone [Candidatus Omnitrophota bacterium]